MAYMKTGAVHEAQTRTKVIIAVVLAVLLLVLACVLFAVKNPRATTQLVLSDQDYSSYVLLKNVRGKGEVYRPYLTRLTENHAYDSEGAVSVELSKDMKDLINSEEVLETAQRYVEQLSFTGNTQTRGLQFSNELKLNDARQTIFTHDLAYLASGIYSTVPEYGYGWTRLFGDAPEQTDEQLYRQRVLQEALSSGDETIQKALSKAGKAAYKAVKKDVEVTIDKDQQLDFQDKHASGERVNVLIDREDAQAFLDVFFSKLQKANGLRDAVNEQLDTIYSLQKKHHVETVEELIALRDQLRQQLDHLDNSSDEIEALRRQEQNAAITALSHAATLTALRKKAAQKVEKEMKSRLVPLGIPNVRFAVDVTPTEQLSEKGADKVAFLFSANTSTPMQPVAQIASGGEIARVMLSLKAMISGTVKLPTIIFDEIDTGVSGRVAEMMAKIMQEMGHTDRQVISITHLPQIAALGSHHYKVYKEETPEGTKSRMQLLSPDDRIQEIAQMLSGSDVTAAAISNAKALLKR